MPLDNHQNQQSTLVQYFENRISRGNNGPVIEIFEMCTSPKSDLRQIRFNLEKGCNFSKGCEGNFFLILE